jgi:plastocyanin
MTVRSRVFWGVGAVAAAALAMACGSSGGGGGISPTPTPDPGTTTPTTTITIANNAVSPVNIVVARGSRVTFVNNDNQPHDMNSNPHPEHTDCPAINDVGFISPGQSRQTGNLNTARTCGFHDHNQDANRNLQGTITVQ